MDWKSCKGGLWHWVYSKVLLNAKCFFKMSQLTFHSWYKCTLSFLHLQSQQTELTATTIWTQQCRRKRKQNKSEVRFFMWYCISKTTRRVSFDIQTPRSGLKNEVQLSFLRPTLMFLDIGWNTEGSFWYSFSNVNFTKFYGN